MAPDPLQKRLAEYAWLTTPATFTWTITDGKWVPARHLDYLADRLADAARTGGKRIIVTMPPRHGKSWLSSAHTPPWYLELFPDRFVCLASYASEFARRWGRMARDIIMSNQARLSVSVRKDVSANDEWETPKGGGMKTAGVGSGLTGRGFHFGVIDDPVKDAKDAWSQLQRDTVWEWYRSVFYTRAEPGASIVLIMTRWHLDDLAGRLLADDAEDWEEIRLPAIAEDDDLLGRKPGEPLWPDRYDIEALARIKRVVGSWVWSALYQQRPMPGEGAIWKKEWIRECWVHPEYPGRLVDDAGNTLTVASHRRYITVDLAMTDKQTSDYTVACVWVEVYPRRYLIDVWRKQAEAPEILKNLTRLAKLHVVDSLVIEAVQGQLYICQLLRADGHKIEEVKPDRDKVSRYRSASVAWERGQVFFLRGAMWRQKLDDELLSVPAAPHDDQADACAIAVLDAAMELTAPPESMLVRTVDDLPWRGIVPPPGY